MVNRDIKNYPSLLTQIERVSCGSPYYHKQLFTSIAGGAILKLNNNNDNFNSKLLTNINKVTIHQKVLPLGIHSETSKLSHCTAIGPPARHP